MNSKIIIGIILTLSVLATTFFISRGSSTEDLGDVPGAVEEKSKSDSGTLADLIDKGDTYCMITGTAEGVAFAGEYWRMGDSFRIEQRSVIDGSPSETFMIDDSESLYTWSDTPYGFVAVRMDSINDTTADGGDIQANPAAPDMQSEVTYECSDWNPDPSRFVPPAGIEFMDVGTPAVAPTFDPSSFEGFDIGDLPQVN